MKIGINRATSIIAVRLFLAHAVAFIFIFIENSPLFYPGKLEVVDCGGYFSNHFIELITVMPFGYVFEFPSDQIAVLFEEIDVPVARIRHDY